MINCETRICDWPNQKYAISSSLVVFRYVNHRETKMMRDLVVTTWIERVNPDRVGAISVENFTGAMRALAELRASVDAFFDKVTVNVDDPKIRENRLRMLSEIRAATLNVADFSKIAG